MPQALRTNAYMVDADVAALAAALGQQLTRLEVRSLTYEGGEAAAAPQFPELRQLHVARQLDIVHRLGELAPRLQQLSAQELVAGHIGMALLDPAVVAADPLQLQLLVTPLGLWDAAPGARAAMAFLQLHSLSTRCLDLAGTGGPRASSKAWLLAESAGHGLARTAQHVVLRDCGVARLQQAALQPAAAQATRLDLVGCTLAAAGPQQDLSALAAWRCLRHLRLEGCHLASDLAAESEAVVGLERVLPPAVQRFEVAVTQGASQSLLDGLAWLQRQRPQLDVRLVHAV